MTPVTRATSHPPPADGPVETFRFEHVPGPFGGAFLAYIVLFLALTFPYWLRGEVIAPFRQTAELAAPDSSGDTHLEHKRFSDYSFHYVPEVVSAFDRSQSRWLALWTDRTELGRPVEHLWGLSPAYPPSWLIWILSDSPYRFLTLLSLITTFLCGAFVLMWCKELGLAPLAAFLAAGSVAASPFFMYWLTFPVFVSAYCWSAGIFYALTRLSKRVDLLGWGVLAFSTYSLLMTGYQQLIVFHAYLFVGYGAHLFYCRWRSRGWASMWHWTTVVLSAVLVGSALALPVYTDVAFNASESARGTPDASFFMANFPKLDSLSQLAAFVALGTFPEFFGNPVSPSFPLVYNGRSATPLVMFLALVCLPLRLRATWGWWAAAVLLCAPVFVTPIYVFGVNYLGFNLSRTNPVGILLLPVAIIAAHGADALIRRTSPYQHRWSVLLAACGTAAVALSAVGYGVSHAQPVRWSIVLLSLAVVATLAFQSIRTFPALLAAALVAICGYISFPLMLRQNPSHIATTSTLVEHVRDHLPAGSRFAVVSPGLSVLPANLNGTVGLASLHSYNSLSARRYHALIRALGGEMQVFGRTNAWIAPDYDSPMFWMSNIALILSPSALASRHLEYLGHDGSVYLHRVLSRMGRSLQLTTRLDDSLSDNVDIADPRAMMRASPTTTMDLGDLLEVELAPVAANLLILSHKFHRDWHAQALTVAGWSTARTIQVNGVFQGVILPDGTRRVTLRFNPHVRFAWVAHVFWPLLLGAWFFSRRRGLRSID